MQMALRNFISPIRLARTDAQILIPIFKFLTVRRGVNKFGSGRLDPIAAKQTCFKGLTNSIEIYYSSVSVYSNKFIGSQFTHS
jgi:hypothetical protein